MVHWWNDPAIEARLGVVYVDMIYLLLGLFGWEYFMSLGVEYALIRGRLSFRWPLVPYILGRICLLTTLVFLAIEMSPTSNDFACQPWMTFVSITGDITIGTSSTNLMIRSWVLWKNSRLVHLLLLLVALGHWTILTIDASNIRAFRSDGTCALYLRHPKVSAGVFLYTVCYDFLVLVLTIVKLSSQPSTQKSPLTERLQTQGLWYFVIAAMTNILPTVFAFLGAGVLVGITGNPAITASTIVSSRAVRSLLELRTSSACNRDDDNAVLTTQLQTQTSLLRWAPTNIVHDDRTVC